MQFTFEWNEEKKQSKYWKTSCKFLWSTKSFLDFNRVVLKDITHSNNEDRYFCLGKVEEHILTVRFSIRGGSCIRIFGAGYWRKGKKIYEKENNI